MSRATAFPQAPADAAMQSPPARATRRFGAALLGAVALATGLGALALPTTAAARPEDDALARVSVYDRTTGDFLPTYRHRGRTYVAGVPGHAYEIVVRNQTGGRVLAVTSVDGVNVLSGATAGIEQGGYVFSPWEEDRIRGWRKNLDEVAQFRFTALPKSYAARTGRPDNVGVIGVALFEERAPRYVQPPRSYDDGGYEERERYEEPGDRGDDRDHGYGYGSGADGRAAREAKPAPASPPAPRAQGNRAADAAAPAAESASGDAASQRREKSRAGTPLGTAHGRRERDATSTTTFERASEQPTQVVTIYYDSRANLVAAGVLPREATRYSRRRPEAFPGGFVPDP